MLALVCLSVQACLSLAPGGADICIKSVLDRLTPRAVEETCQCCREESSDEPVAPEHWPNSAPGCGCCITMPVLDRPAPPLVVESPVFLAWVAVPIELLPPACEIACSDLGRPPPRHPPPSFAAELRSIRLVI
jgi:hypothetical protein